MMSFKSDEKYDYLHFTIVLIFHFLIKKRTWNLNPGVQVYRTEHSKSLKQKYFSWVQSLFKKFLFLLKTRHFNGAIFLFSINS